MSDFFTFIQLGFRHITDLEAMDHILFLLALAAIAGAPAAGAADMNKTLRVAFLIDVTGFDPQAISDLYSDFVNRHIFDPLYNYDYLARPYKLVTNTAAALPEVTTSRPLDGSHAVQCDA